MKCYSFYPLIFIVLALSGCYKKDLEEFKKMEYNYKPEMVFPLFNASLTVKDSIPFYFPTFALSDTIKVNFSPSYFLDENYINEINYVELKLVTENTFPIKGNFQLYFTNDNGKIIDSLFLIHKTISPASSQNHPQESTIIIYMDENKYSKIRNSSKIYIYFSLDKKYFSTLSNFSIRSGIKFGLDANGKL